MLANINTPLNNNTKVVILLILLTFNTINMTINDIPMTDIPLNWKDLKKRGRSGKLIGALRSLPIGKAIEAEYGTAKVYVSKLNVEFPDREYNHFRQGDTYYIGRTA